MTVKSPESFFVTSNEARVLGVSTSSLIEGSMACDQTKKYDTHCEKVSCLSRKTWLCNQDFRRLVPFRSNKVGDYFLEGPARESSEAEVSDFYQTTRVC